LPPLDFSTLVFPLYTQALISLGQMTDPEKNKVQENLEMAKRFIDLLDLLKKKTEENLTAEEEKFLSSCLHQLKMIYMEKVKAINL
ncbi:MAG: DUF1844 domain-containing protein, partial [Acidobacteriota bacterium]